MSFKTIKCPEDWHITPLEWTEEMCNAFFNVLPAGSADLSTATRFKEAVLAAPQVCPRCYGSPTVISCSLCQDNRLVTADLAQQYLSLQRRQVRKPFPNEVIALRNEHEKGKQK